MGYINVFVGSECYIKIKNKQLVLTKNTGETMDYPLEDLNSVLIENQFTTTSVQSLNKLIENNVIVYFCNEKHLPISYLLGCNSFYKNLEIYNYQVQVSKPQIKQLWKKIIVSKISNQNKVLEILNKHTNLLDYVSRIKSGDADNIESVVANKYFKILFGVDFARRENSIINYSLNYGYAIIRGAIARSVVSHGLQPFLGIHHCNKLNNFNLVDDLMEPFRPLVDLFVYQNIVEQDESLELNPKIKLKLQGLLSYDVKIDNSLYAVTTAIDMLVYSFVNCLKNKNDDLKLPIITRLKVHEYE